MKKLLLAGAAALAIAGSTVALAQHRQWIHAHMQMIPRTGRPSPTRGSRRFMPG